MVTNGYFAYCVGNPEYGHFFFFLTPTEVHSTDTFFGVFVLLYMYVGAGPWVTLLQEVGPGGPEPGEEGGALLHP